MQQHKIPRPPFAESALPADLAPFFSLSQNNADEGPLFTPPNITTEADLLAWLHLSFPLMGGNDIAKILLYYPSSNASTDAGAPDFATLGYTGPTAVNQSDVATGQQQRADNIYAETTFGQSVPPLSAFARPSIAPP